MKKLLMILLVILLAIPVCAETPLVLDEADLLLSHEEQYLTEQLEVTREQLGIDVVVLTVETINGQTPKSYADGYYDYNGYGPDGVLLLLAMESREWYISTTGSCIASVDADDIGDVIVPYLSDGEYYKAFSLFGQLVHETMLWPETDGEYGADEYHNVSPQPHKRNWYEGLGVCLLIGLAVGGITVGVMASGMKTVRSKAGAADYVKPGSLELSVAQDLYLYQTVTRRAKPKNTGTHGGSSGHSHGGGGGRF